MNRQTRSTFFIALMVLLGLVLVAQSIYLVRLNGKLEELEAASTGPDSIFDSAVTGGSAAGAGLLGNHDPFSAMRQMQAQMDAVFDSVLGNVSAFPPVSGGMSTSPSIEVSETDNDYQIVIGVPENGELELSTEIEDNTVRLSGTVNVTRSTDSNSLASSFTSRSQFSRSIPLSQRVDPLALHTDQEEHAVVITIPKV